MRAATVDGRALLGCAAARGRLGARSAAQSASETSAGIPPGMRRRRLLDDMTPPCAGLLLGNVGELGAALHHTDRRLRTNSVALARQRLLAVLLPPPDGRGLGIAFPILGPGAEIVTMPRRPHGQGMKPELLPERARTLHIFLARQIGRAHV